VGLDARPLAKLLGQVAPCGTGAGNPEYAIENKSVVGGRATTLTSHRYKKGFKERPLGILHQQPRQDKRFIVTVTGRHQTVRFWPPREQKQALGPADSIL